MNTIFWSIFRTLVMLACSIYWISAAVNTPWPYGLFALAWVVFLTEGTRNEIKAIRNGERT